MVRAGGAIDDATPPEALHELRKSGKELRYLLEFFTSLYPAEVVKPMVGTLRALQDTLGRFQDREVQAGRLNAMRAEVVSLADGPSALMAMGVLVARLEHDKVAARSEFAERFADFAAKSQRALVRATFA
jgi:CHAD domain-containing protein